MLTHASSSTDEKEVPKSIIDHPLAVPGRGQRASSSKSTAAPEKVSFAKSASVLIPKESLRLLPNEMERLGGGDLVRPSLETIEWRTKKIILIRHGRSLWNEMLGAHKKQQRKEEEKSRKGVRKAFKELVRPRSEFDGARATESHDLHGASSPAEGRKGGFWKGVRGGVKQMANVIGHADRLHQVDHPLSWGGMGQVRTLRKSISVLLASPQSGASADLVRCSQWFVSPYLRALMTAAYALAPLHKNNSAMRIQVTPMANEIVSTPVSYDCAGKRGNVGLRVVTRAIGKITDYLEAEAEETDENALVADRQGEISDVCSVLCAMDLNEILHQWWRDLGGSRKEHMQEDDARCRALALRMLREPEPVVGLVGHSLLFQRILQLFWPKDVSMQNQMRTALRNGDSTSSKDPYNDKIMNCGTLVVTWRFRVSSKEEDRIDDAEIVAAEFLFDGHMESALSGDQQSLEVPETGEGSEDLYNFIKEAEEADMT